MKNPWKTFTEHAVAVFKNTKAEETANATKIGGKTETMLTADFTKETAGLGWVENQPTLSTYTNNDETKTDFYVTPSWAWGFLTKATSFLRGTAGKVLFVLNANTPRSVELDFPVQSVGITSTVAESDQTKASGIYTTVVEITSKRTWYKVSGSWVEQPANTHKQIIKANRFYANRVTGFMYYADSPDSVVPF